METSIGTGNGQNEDQAVLAKKAEKSGAHTGVSSRKSAKNTSRKDKNGSESLNAQDVLLILENALLRVSRYWQSPRIIDSTTTIVMLPPEIGYCQKCGHFRTADSISNKVCRSCSGIDSTIETSTVTATP